jgi:hypothetical protein
VAGVILAGQLLEKKADPGDFEIGRNCQLTAADACPVSNPVNYET